MGIPQLILALIHFSLMAVPESRSADFPGGLPSASGVVHSGGGRLLNGSVVSVGQSVIGLTSGRLPAGGNELALDLLTGYLPQVVQSLSIDEPSNPEPPRILGVVVGDNRSLELSVTGPLGIAFRLQQSSDLVQWRDLSSFPLAAPVIRIMVPGAVDGGPKAAFFRLAWIPGQ